MSPASVPVTVARIPKSLFNDSLLPLKIVTVMSVDQNITRAITNAETGAILGS